MSLSSPPVSGPAISGSHIWFVIVRSALLGLAIQYVSIRSTIFNASICKARIVNNGAESEVPQMVSEIDKGSKWLLLLNLAGFQVAFEVVKHRQKYYFKA